MSTEASNASTAFLPLVERRPLGSGHSVIPVLFGKPAFPWALNFPPSVGHRCCPRAQWNGAIGSNNERPTPTALTDDVQEVRLATASRKRGRSRAVSPTDGGKIF